ncbi:shikimate kinase [Vulgatibacter incomptus]|uniref:Shikimate kinase n=1 Tax=Vulgatibacter incomptus TaxID=1391653 RepID=A0A0K1PB27_9BACT|nr:shikimate kinase [Vulgatibacter incomptus]AKU90631.1 Regulatory protein of benzoate catabolism [Vulgatibacter incomptus]
MIDLLRLLGQRVRELRLEKGLSLRQLAKASGLSERFLSDLEAGRGNISVARLADVAAALGRTAAGLLREAEASGEAQRVGVISLLGLRGAGKSTIGPKLASRLGLPFFELDGLVESRAELSLAELFSIHGEDYYRRLEREELERFLASHDRAVLSTGGGIVAHAESLRVLEERTVMVWLRADADDHWSRVVGQGDIRPMADRPAAKAELRRLLVDREPLYAKARLQVDTTRLGIAGAVDELVERLAQPAVSGTSAAQQ